MTEMYSFKKKKSQMLQHKLGFVLFQLNMFLTALKRYQCISKKQILAARDTATKTWQDMVKYWAESSKENNEMLYLV